MVWSKYRFEFLKKSSSEYSEGTLQAEIHALRESNEILRNEKEQEVRQIKDLLIEKEEEISELQGWSSPKEDTDYVIHSHPSSLKSLSQEQILQQETNDPKQTHEAFLLSLKEEIQKLSATLDQKTRDALIEQTQFHQEKDSEELHKNRTEEYKYKLNERDKNIQSLEFELTKEKNMNETLQNSQKKCKDYEFKISEQEDIIISLELRLNSETDQINLLSNKVSDLEGKIMKQGRELNSKASALEITGLNETLSEKNDEYEKLKKYVEECKNENDSLTKKPEETLQMIQTSVDDVMEEKNVESQVVQCNIQELQKKESLIMGLQKDLLSLNDWKEKALSTIEVNSLDEFQQRLEELIKQNNNNSQMNEHLLKKIAKMIGQRYSKEKVLELEKSFNDFEKKNNLLLVEIESKDEIINDLNTKIDHLSKSEEDFELKLNAHKKELDELNEKLLQTEDLFEKNEEKKYLRFVKKLDENLHHLKAENNILKEQSLKDKELITTSTQKLELLQEKETLKFKKLQTHYHQLPTKNISGDSNESNELRNRHQESIKYHEESQRLSKLIEMKDSEILSLKEQHKPGTNISKDFNSSLQENKIVRKTIFVRVFGEDSDDKKITITQMESTILSLKDELHLRNSELDKLKEQSTEYNEAKTRLQLTIKEKEYDLAMAQKNLQHIEKNGSVKYFNTRIEKLKQHLVSVEDGYTQDALEYQNCVTDLKTKLLSTEEALRISSASIVLQFKKPINYKEQTKAVENLQIALDGFRREQENEIRFSQQYLQDKLKKKSGLEGAKWSWFGGSLDDSSNLDESLASAFVKFLETESGSKGSILSLPAEISKSTSDSISVTPSSIHLPGHKRTESSGSVSSSSKLS
ncbi:unnamed protein product [Lepeophtheirus salmonis]|uniref:(salmon louse) hypothetical protein n=1 Tax=Lepeophtheirus salmonis TaxID=72036 RepID=A0A7R8HC45_LEPSM|nr:unnamed protein product [Lepeophtheirus salmonis]CAF3006476.1 unnamed protein product [Lepeophtheirus salmonis]